MRVIRSLLWGGIAFLALGRSLQAASELRIENGKTVLLNYKLFVEEDLLEKSDSEHPFAYVHGDHQIVPGLEKGLTGLKVGDRKTIRVVPEEAYGRVDPRAFLEVEKEELPPDVSAKKGTVVEARHRDGRRMVVQVAQVKKKTVVLDFNHPLAGKELEFQIEVLSIA